MTMMKQEENLPILSKIASRVVCGFGLLSIPSAAVGNTVQRTKWRRDGGMRVWRYEKIGGRWDRLIEVGRSQNLFAFFKTHNMCNCLNLNSLQKKKCYW